MQTSVPVDPLISAEWTSIATGTRVLQRLLQRTPLPDAHSAWGGLDSAYPLQPASARVKGYLESAVEHLILWADFIAPLVIAPGMRVDVSLRPGYTLARASLEAAAQAVWVMSPTTRNECLLRHLRLVRWDLEEYRKSKLDLNQKKVVMAQEQSFLQDVAHLLDQSKVVPPNGYLEVIRAACAATDLTLDADTAERLWRAASGAAHGKHWPNIELRTTVTARNGDSEPTEIAGVPDPAGITEVLRAGYDMTQYAALKFVLWSGFELVPLWSDALEWVASKLQSDLPSGEIDQMVQAAVADLREPRPQT